MVYSKEIDSLLNDSLTKDKLVYEKIFGEGSYAKDNLGEYVMNSEQRNSGYGWLNFESKMCNGKNTELTMCAGKDIKMHIEIGDYVSNDNPSDPKMGDMCFEDYNDILVLNHGKILYRINLNNVNVKDAHSLCILYDYVTQILNKGKLNERDSRRFTKLKENIEANFESLSKGHGMSPISLADYDLQDNKFMKLKTLQEVRNRSKRKALINKLEVNNLIDAESKSNKYSSNYDSFIKNAIKYVNKKRVKSFKGKIKFDKLAFKRKVKMDKKVLFQQKNKDKFLLQDNNLNF